MNVKLEPPRINRGSLQELIGDLLMPSHTNDRLMRKRY